MTTRPDLAIPSLIDQAQRLVSLGVPNILGQHDSTVQAAAEALTPSAPSGSLLVPGGPIKAYDKLMRLVVLNSKPGFIVEDLIDLTDFRSYDGMQALTLPDQTWYLLVDPQRGDEFENATPAEALFEIQGRNRVAITATEGIMWALQCPPTAAGPGVLERNHCFMTIATRKPKEKPKGSFDSRTPALWISNGTGRDGVEKRNAAKLGWCWWNNRHTWLGIAHAQERLAT
ncbi:DUF5701 family protein [Actinomyces minihominis]|uniref:DUF5701 family protein n=1 Tax=Actinomyces minihominis TaxID=2002838 RepID=UPI000C07563E|nr:DUF5701 family protein [Actinomyces minihominis]